MISLDLASRLAAVRAARGPGLGPAAGDRFHIPDREIDQVFVISDMTIETARLPSGLLIRFNGTTEWALDSIEADEVVWLPREEQLRAMLGDRFVRLGLWPTRAGRSPSPTAAGMPTRTPSAPTRWRCSRSTDRAELLAETCPFLRMLAA